MNPQRFRELADVVEKAGTEGYPEFDMSNWFRVEKDGFRWVDVNEIKSLKHECRTVGCLAGFACWNWPDEADEAQRRDYGAGFSTAAGYILGLIEIEASIVFLSGDSMDATKEQAAAYLRACGKVLEWSDAVPDLTVDYDPQTLTEV